MHQLGAAVRASTAAGQSSSHCSCPGAASTAPVSMQTRSNGTAAAGEVTFPAYLHDTVSLLHAPCTTCFCNELPLTLGQALACRPGVMALQALLQQVRPYSLDLPHRKVSCMPALCMLNMHLLHPALGSTAPAEQMYTGSYGTASFHCSAESVADTPCGRLTALQCRAGR